MGYWASVDLGTTYSAAAVLEEGHAEAVNLGSSSLSIPSVVFLRDDGSWLVGSGALQRATGEPDRVAREFKRRIGDPIPIIVGGQPFSPEDLTEVLLRHILAEVETRQGRQPDGLVVTHPANWGRFRLDALTATVSRLVNYPFSLLPEPVAAALHYADTADLATGDLVCVYDLGGGTFDAALLSKTDTGFEFVGQPLGLDRFGGIDLDTTLLSMVLLGAEIDPSELDENDPSVANGLLALRRSVSEAKIILSSDTDTSVNVLVGVVSKVVRIDRAEFEQAIRPRIDQTIDVVSHLLERSGVTPDRVGRVLLVGGSSRIPLVTQLLSSRLGRPVALDTDPKGAVSLGAALSARTGARPDNPAPTPATGPPPVAPDPIPAAAPPPTPASKPAATAAPVVYPAQSTAPAYSPPTQVQPSVQPVPVGRSVPPRRRGSGGRVAVLVLLVLAIMGAGAYALVTRADRADTTSAATTQPPPVSTEGAAPTTTSDVDPAATAASTVEGETVSSNVSSSAPAQTTTTQTTAEAPTTVDPTNPGFGTAICHSPASEIVFGGSMTTGFDVAVCLDEGGRLEYVGHKQTSDSGIRLAACSIGNAVFLADNDGTVYRIDVGFGPEDTTIVVTSPSGSILVDDTFVATADNGFVGLPQC